MQNNLYEMKDLFNDEIEEKITFVYNSKIHENMNPDNFKTRHNFKNIIIPYGINTELFKKDYNLPREPYRFCYTSSHSKGLLEVLKHTWPIIRKGNQNAEFHIYYDVNESRLTEDGVSTLKKLFNQEGVVYHGRVSHEEIAKELQRSSYLTIFTGKLF